MSRFLHIQNLERHNDQPARVKYCDSFLCRLRGFTFHGRIEPGEGLLLVGARDSRLDTAIHMVFVPFALTVIWIDSSLTVVDKVLAKPWRLAYFPGAPARYILELHPHRWDDFQVGDEVIFHDV